MEFKERKEWMKIIRPQSQFVKYYRRIALLDEDTERVERSMLIKLDLKQRYTSLREAHVTGVMSAAVLGFTVITIIFTPLSFVTSLFALSIDRFQKHQVDWFIPGHQDESSETNMTRAYTRSYIGKWMGKFSTILRYIISLNVLVTAEIASTVIALGAMWLVIEYAMKEPLAKKLWHRIQKCCGMQERKGEQIEEQSLDAKKSSQPLINGQPKTEDSKIAMSGTLAGRVRRLKNPWETYFSVISPDSQIPK